MEYYRDNAEYQRVEGDGYLHPREGRLRVISIIIFIIHALAEIGWIYVLFRTAVHKEDVRVYLSLVLINAFGLYLFANGLFGHRNRKTCLTIYVCLFQLLAGGIWIYNTLSLAIGFGYFRDEIQKELDKQKSDVSATLLVFIFMAVTAFMAMYHGFAAWVINSYKQIRVDRESEF